MRKLVGFGIFSLALLLAAASDGRACSCNSKAPVCEAYGGSKAVFVGKVIEGKSFERMSEMFAANTRELTFKFAVSRAFIGAKVGETVSIQTGVGFGDCGFPFEPGEEYIVYAYEYKGKLRTSVCARTTHISRASEDLDSLKTLPRRSGASVSGVVTRYERSSLLGEPLVPSTRQKIGLVRAGEPKRFETLTDSEGRYEFSKLPQGRYRVQSILEPGWELDDYETAEFLLNEHGCATQDMSIENDMEAKVIVIDPDGKPVAGTWIEWVPVGINSLAGREPREFGATNPQGQVYEFDIPPGRYTVSINLFHAPDEKAPFPATFAPGVFDRAAAQIVEVKPGSELGEIFIRIPKRLPPSTVSGSILWPDGSPASAVSVGLTDVMTNNICVNDCGKTDAAGRFKLTGFPGREYKIWVRGDKRAGEQEHVYRVESSVFTITTGLEPFRLRLRRSKD